MKKLLMPALGAAFALGVPLLASAQVMVPGQPGWTTSNRTLPPGSPGLSPQNVPSPSPFSTVPPPPLSQTPFIGQHGELNRAEPEFALPGEPDASGRIGPTIDRQRARFTGERGPDGKLLPTYLPDRAQAGPPAQQTAPQSEERMRGGQTQTPPSPQMQRQQTPGERPGSGAPDQSGQMAPPPIEPPQGAVQQPPAGQPRTGQPGTAQQRRTTQPPADRQSQAGNASQREMSETAALNALSAEGYTNIGRIERVGGNWQATAMKDGRQVTVSIDPRTRAVREQ